VVDTAFYTAMGMQQYVPQGYHPREQAEQLLRQMAGFTQDIAMVSSRGQWAPGAKPAWTRRAVAAHVLLRLRTQLFL
jgi:hypothetical protein